MEEQEKKCLEAIVKRLKAEYPAQEQALTPTMEGLLSALKSIEQSVSPN